MRGEASAFDEGIDIELLMLGDEGVALALEKSQERRDAGRVELAARVLVQFPHDAVEGHGLAVGPVTRHGLDGVAHQDQARGERDLVALQVIGVTPVRAVEPLVVVAHARHDVAQELDGLEDLGTDFRVFLEKCFQFLDRFVMLCDGSSSYLHSYLG